MDWLTLAPPAAAVAITLWRRNVFLALFGALAVSETLMGGGDPIRGTADAAVRIVAAAVDPGNAQVLAFCLLAGAFAAAMDRSGGTSSLVRALTRRGFAETPRGAALSTTAAGTALFIETNVSLLTAGLIARPLFDKHGLSRARLAYLIDSTSSPVSVLILLNGWGAFALGLIDDYDFARPAAIVAGSIPLNFYALLAVGGAYYVAATGRVFGPMRRAEAARRGRNPLEREDAAAETPTSSSSSLYAALPLSVLIILFAFALSASLRELGTGDFIAQIASGAAPVFMLPALIFVATGLMSLTTGTSWGSYGIMIPLAMPLAMAAGVPPALALAAVLGGGVFGDHCSPISDTTVIASLAAGCDHLEHVKTQAPYAGLAGAAALGFYLLAGAVLT